MERLYRFYKGAPVKRMRRGQHGIILTFLSATAGVPGRQETISQADWDAHGEWKPAPVKTEDIRKLSE